METCCRGDDKRAVRPALSHQQVSRCTACFEVRALVATDQVLADHQQRRAAKANKVRLILTFLTQRLRLPSRFEALSSASLHSTPACSLTHSATLPACRWLSSAISHATPV
jgi:hypothetical protein